MKKKDVIGIDVSKLTIDAYLKLAQAHAVFGNDTKGFRLTMVKVTGFSSW